MSMGGFSSSPFPHRTRSILIMLLQSSWAVLLLCASATFLGWLNLAAPSEKVGTPQSWDSPLKSPSRQPRVTASSGMKPHPGRYHIWTPVTVRWLWDSPQLGNLDSGILHPGQPLCLVWEWFLGVKAKF